MSSTLTVRQSATDVLAKTLKVNEIFLSLQGETTKTGLPTAFIRLTGCPLRCHYCDTAYAFYEGKPWPIDRILHEIAGYRTTHVTVTGGEPLAQKNCPDLLSQLCDEDYQVSLETSGAMDISSIDPRVINILDIKTPDSGESDKNRYDNLQHLHLHDQVKFVICSREDYDWSKKCLFERQLNEHCEVLFSPSHDDLEAKQLADWIIKDKLPVRFQIQLHKYVWGNVPGK